MKLLVDMANHDPSDYKNAYRDILFGFPPPPPPPPPPPILCHKDFTMIV